MWKASQEPNLRGFETVCAALLGPRRATPEETIVGVSHRLIPTQPTRVNKRWEAVPNPVQSEPWASAHGPRGGCEWTAG